MPTTTRTASKGRHKTAKEITPESLMGLISFRLPLQADHYHKQDHCGSGKILRGPIPFANKSDNGSAHKAGTSQNGKNNHDLYAFAQRLQRKLSQP